MAKARNDPYQAAFDRAGGGSIILGDQQWVQFLDLLVDKNFLSDEIVLKFRQEHEGQPHTFELFQRDLCTWVDAQSTTHVDGIIDELKKKTQFLRQVIDAEREADPINVSFLHPVITQAEALRGKLTGSEEATNDALASKWVESDLFGSDDHASESDRACPWKFQQANARYLRVEERQRARHQFRLHQCDESTDRVLKETFYPVLEQFREVQIGMATFTYPKLRDEDDKDPELAIAVMLRRQSASEGALAWLDNLVSAYRQLSLSPYVQQYLGTEDISGTKQETEDVTTRHYFEFVQARSLSEMLLDDGVLHEASQLFKLYARELLLAIIDLLEQSTHQLNTRLMPDNVMISHSGRRLFLGKLDFGDYIDPFQSKSLSTVMQKREKALLQDLSVILFTMLYPVTLPRNLPEFRSRYLGHRDCKFVFRYRINCKSKCKRPNENAICVSCSDTFAVVVAGDNLFDEMWTCQISKSSVLACIARRYSPIEFHFHAKVRGECTITFSPLGSSTVGAFALAVTICHDNFRLHQRKAQTLISACAAVSEASSTLPQVSSRLLLHQHEFFQPLSKHESHQVEHELLERV
ncbi:hypothetical protein PC129_g20177 [Phytophthora cactorum]|uniref:Uncharacterized protein n=1 Tax=Phytophthora cactorum TaxID=29920 RepID=A0A329T0Z1_9STRA|nr:hypothetical protein Pcac1_g23118 [Phytophthora cactorum]KAG2800911.1 hypothetical protein PC111_g19765 [Phytophthora cactorum]KAG2821901.1 hypothetical protein PC112_g11161 [Phytophthora cactorum]KAG2833364.1 hypothetical protein PC113_g20582 [Phytophthora cactorum]KAG2879930.1 hypothetical protein PC114_g22319 [Phytophthora cactorum]